MEEDPGKGLKVLEGGNVRPMKMGDNPGGCLGAGAHRALGGRRPGRPARTSEPRPEARPFRARSVGAARAAVLSTPGRRPCPRRARGLGAPGCYSRPAREPGKGPAGGRGGRGWVGGPRRSRVSGPRPWRPAGLRRAPSPTRGPRGRLRPERALPEFRAAARRPREVRAGPPQKLASGRAGAVCRAFPALRAARERGPPLPLAERRGPSAGAPAWARATRPLWEAKRESSKSGQGAGRFAAEGCACEGRPVTSAFLPPRAALPGPPRDRVRPAPPAPSSGPLCLPPGRGCCSATRWPPSAPRALRLAPSREGQAEVGATLGWLLTARRPTFPETRRDGSELPE
ncbi:translation initiation factor IF-2-like [Mustela erminea]|uniref:translation initiation factor IF-2-like n=1 Tax=Mustela erminea TaxID=36723 RepID=UPI0013873D94|nr:translation initiation factor IF-2-like [Mustela erminea]